MASLPKTASLSMTCYGSFLKKQYGPHVFRIFSIVQKQLLTSTKECQRHGRVHSLQSELSIIRLLKRHLGARCIQTLTSSVGWYDFCLVQGNHHMFFNIKVSKGGRIDAFNKAACVYSLTTLSLSDIPTRGMSLNTMVQLLKEHPRVSRNRREEYYYIFIDKVTRECFIKSFCDIQHWVPTSHNLLQIEWDKEKQDKCRLNNATRTYALRKRVIELLKTSIRKYLATCSLLVSA